MSDFEAGVDVRGFFIEHLAAAMQDLRVETASATRGYLDELLSGFAESDRIPQFSTPIVEHLQLALAAQGSERQARLQVMGDIALFLCGFFPDCFDRRGLSETYLVELGGRAYLMVARGGARDGHVFVELASRFRQLVRVLDEVRERTNMCGDGEIIRLYERFRERGSPELERRLRRRGVVPTPTGSLPN
jgi:hypothetical protein